MDLEETKKIIQNKITADELTREVRSQIKSCYILKFESILTANIEPGLPVLLPVKLKLSKLPYL